MFIHRKSNNNTKMITTNTHRYIMIIISINLFLYFYKNRRIFSINKFRFKILKLILTFIMKLKDKDRIFWRMNN